MEVAELVHREAHALPYPLVLVVSPHQDVTFAACVRREPDVEAIAVDLDEAVVRGCVVPRAYTAIATGRPSGPSMTPAPTVSANM